MKIRQLHKWNLSYQQARQLQSRLACKVRFKAVRKKPELIAGLDCAFSKDGRRITAAVVVLRLPDFETVETGSSTRKVNFPYIPGLLSFREAPCCIAAVQKLKFKPDVFMVDGQGVAHPRRLGLAAHLGLFFETTTIGCAKSRLVETFSEPPLKKGGFTILKDNEDTIGAVLRTRDNVKPLFISVGNLCRLQDAIEITLRCVVKFRLPEPTRLAHHLVSKMRLKL